MTLPAHYFGNPEENLDRILAERAAEEKREARRIEYLRKKKAKKHKRQVLQAMKGK